MLDHGLEIVVYGLKLRQSHLLPIGAPPESQAAQSEAWTAAIAYAALMHDVGKVAVDIDVEYANGERWHPWHGELTRPYRFRYRKDRAYRLHGAAAGLLYSQVLTRTIFDWLSGFPELWSSLLYVLAGQYEHAGVLGELVQQADRASVALELGGDPAKARTDPRHALQRKLLDGLRYLIKEQFRLNQPQASDGWLTHDALWLVSKTACDKLRAHLLSQGIDGVPSNNTTLFDVLQDHGIAQRTPEGKAIWRATVEGAEGWIHQFTLLKLSPALVWAMDERPPPFAGSVRVNGGNGNGEYEKNPLASRPSRVESISTPSDSTDSAIAPWSIRNSVEPAADFEGPAAAPAAERFALESSDENEAVVAAVINEKAADPVPAPRHDPSTPSTAEDAGLHFMAWAHRGVHGRRLKVNNAYALVHTVAGTVFLVTPGIFHRYVQEHPGIEQLARQDGLAAWEWIQKQFERMRIHKKQTNGHNIWTCEVNGPRKTRRLHGYLLADGHRLIAQIPFDNPYLRITSVHDPVTAATKTNS